MRETEWISFPKKYMKSNSIAHVAKNKNNIGCVKCTKRFIRHTSGVFVLFFLIVYTGKREATGMTELIYIIVFFLNIRLIEIKKLYNHFTYYSA